jgi:hypothetical protein
MPKIIEKINHQKNIIKNNPNLSNDARLKETNKITNFENEYRSSEKKLSSIRARLKSETELQNRLFLQKDGLSKEQGKLPAIEFFKKTDTGDVSKDPEETKRLMSDPNRISRINAICDMVLLDQDAAVAFLYNDEKAEQRISIENTVLNDEQMALAIDSPEIFEKDDGSLYVHDVGVLDSIRKKIIEKLSTVYDKYKQYDSDSPDKNKQALLKEFFDLNFSKIETAYSKYNQSNVNWIDMIEKNKEHYFEHTELVDSALANISVNLKEFSNEIKDVNLVATVLTGKTPVPKERVDDKYTAREKRIQEILSTNPDMIEALQDFSQIDLDTKYKAKLAYADAEDYFGYRSQGEIIRQTKEYTERETGVDETDREFSSNVKDSASIDTYYGFIYSWKRAISKAFTELENFKLTQGAENTYTTPHVEEVDSSDVLRRLKVFKSALQLASANKGTDPKSYKEVSNDSEQLRKLKTKEQDLIEKINNFDNHRSDPDQAAIQNQIDEIDVALLAIKDRNEELKNNTTIPNAADLIKQNSALARDLGIQKVRLQAKFPVKIDLEHELSVLQGKIKPLEIKIQEQAVNPEKSPSSDLSWKNLEIDSNYDAEAKKYLDLSTKIDQYISTTETNTEGMNSILNKISKLYSFKTPKTEETKNSVIDSIIITDVLGITESQAASIFPFLNKERNKFKKEIKQEHSQKIKEEERKREELLKQKTNRRNEMYPKGNV